MKFLNSIYTRILGGLVTLSLMVLASGFCYLLYQEYKGNLEKKERDKEIVSLSIKKSYPSLGAMPDIGVKEAKFKTKFIAREMFYSMLLITSDRPNVLEQQSYKINLLDADRFKIQEVEVPIDGLVRSLDEKGKLIGFLYKAKTPIEVGVYKSIQDWELVRTAK